MAKYLVIVEAPNKTRSYAKHLGKDFDVMATVGHVVDLPSKGMNIKIKKHKPSCTYLFDPNYEVMDDKRAIVKRLVNAASKYQEVYLMLDQDREGEAIAWHVNNELPQGTIVKRASTNSITKNAIQQAIKNAGTINQDLVNAYEARRIVDRIVGYKCSYLTKTATGGRSVGRVQSAALRVLFERESEIQSFKPQEYWDITAELLTVKKEKVSAKLAIPDRMKIDSKVKADKIVAALTGQSVTIETHDVKKITSKPYSPFTTSTLQQAASTYIGWSPKKTMSVAQSIYATGHITYHRTDSTSISPPRLAALRNVIGTSFAPSYLPSQSRIYKSAVKNAQEAHEAILPNDPSVQACGSGSDERKLYKLIWERSVASQMTDSQSESISVKFAHKPYELESKGSRLIFDGWKKVWHYALSQDVILPKMAKGDKLDVIDIDAEQKFTQPPPRYKGASLVRMLEKTGIGRPSTFASIIDTLLARDYVEEKKKSFYVTELGMKVVDFLKNANFCFIDLKFTASMENDLDNITNQKDTKEQVLDTFYKRLLQDIDNAKQVKLAAMKTGQKCPNCNQELLMRHGKFGSFFACEDKDNCKFTADIGDDGKPKPKPIKVYGTDACPKCKSNMIQRKSKYGTFFGCEKYPDCRGMRDDSGSPIEPKKGSYKRTRKKSGKKTRKKSSRKSKK